MIGFRLKDCRNDAVDVNRNAVDVCHDATSKFKKTFPCCQMMTAPMDDAVQKFTEL